MSMAYLLPPASHSSSSPSTNPDSEPPTNEDTTVGWCCLMIQKAVKQLLFQTDCSASVSQGTSGLNVLVVDEQEIFPSVLVSCLKWKVSTIIITTPDVLSMTDVRRDVSMFRKLEIPLTELIINNGYFICPNCPERHYLFGGNPNESENTFAKGHKAMEMDGDRIIRELPLLVNMRRGGERGIPYALSGRGIGNNDPRKVWLALMTSVAERIWGEIQFNTS
ncbi:hypothetical protein F5877DRAFT_67720 [Lentinula edodes]|nr:hypothetical protein F5877DRAFT_67720 [Lentinula edodes]